MRIIAGRYRGRRLRAPEGLHTRPTLDRAREAIFMILGDLSGTAVLDLYAGTGAMGLEALSRGATRAVFIENDHSAALCIRQNLETIGAAKEGVVMEQTVTASKARLRQIGPFDLIVADPPWPIAQEAALEVAAMAKVCATAGARILIGHPTAHPVDLPESSGLLLVDRRKWGGSGMSFYELLKVSEDLPNNAENS